MTRREYPRGSEWRRWDLQVHTPFSALNKEFGGDFDHYAKTLLQKATANRIAVIGLTDYFSIEGYRRARALAGDPQKLKELLGPDLAEEAQRILFLPNIELRISVIITGPGGGDSRVNYHVIFSEEISPADIEEHFLRELKFTAESNTDRPDERWSLTLNNLENLGRNLKEQHSKFRNKSDLFVGMMNAVVAHEDVTEVLDRQTSRFKNRFMLALPADEDLSKVSWSGQGHLTRKLIVQKSHMLFSSNSGTRDFGLGKKHPSKAAFLDEFKSLKPCIHGCDAHSYDRLFEGRQLWIKADPTFQGLRQLLFEPETRVRIGDVPPGVLQVEQNPTKYIESIGFKRTSLARQGENWFDGTLSLNSGLIAIIGNKGSGKSALADVLAMLGDTRASEHFSFLKEERFLSRKTNLASMFEAKLVWKSGRDVERRLDKPIDGFAPELVKYIPQNFLETICSSIEESGFNSELEEVIFSHVDEAQKHSRENLEDVLDYLTRPFKERIRYQQDKLVQLNDELVDLEGQLTSEHRQSLEAQLKQRIAELDAHLKIKPTEVKKPELDPVTQESLVSITERIKKLQDDLNAVEQSINTAREQEIQSTQRISAADNLLERLSNLEQQVSRFHAECLDDANKLEIDTHQLVTLKVNRDLILDAKRKAENDRRAAAGLLEPEDEGSLVTTRLSLEKEIADRRQQLDEPNRKYQEYVEAVKDWEATRRTIEGTADEVGTVKGLTAKLAKLTELPGMLNEAKQKRNELACSIYQAKLQIQEQYRVLYAPVQRFIDRHPVSRKRGDLQVEASIADEGFAEGLLRFIHQGRKGTFQGEREGREKLSELVKAADFATVDGVQTFLRTVLDHLTHDLRDEERKPVQLKDQLIQDAIPQDVYNYLFKLDYLQATFELRWQGKPLDQLSPGERGNLLLVFYLLIDKRDVPLIIDQPEENLDNQTITRTLVPAIKEAKERRQIVIVTHNPNLAVVCDADQIIHSRMEKAKGNRVTYTSGAIEAPAITKLIIDVLEGTKPAFDLRDAKYEILERSPVS